MLRAFRQQFELEETNAFHAFAPLAASMRVINGIPLGCTLSNLPLTVITLNPVHNTVKALNLIAA